MRLEPLGVYNSPVEVTAVLCNSDEYIYIYIYIYINKYTRNIVDLLLY